MAEAQDPTYAAVHLTIWAFAEHNTGLMAASRPALKSTFERLLRRFGMNSDIDTPDPAYGSTGSSRQVSGKGAVGNSYARDDDATEDDDNHSRGHTYELHGRFNKRTSKADTEARNLEEDERHILAHRPGLISTP